MLRTTLLQPSIALDRNEATRAKPGKGEEVVGKKKNLQLSHSVFKQTNIERLLVTSNITTARKCWQFAVGYSKLKTVVGTGGQSSPGFDQQAASVLWWILNNPPSTRRTHKYVGVNDMMTEYYEISHSSIQSEEILYPTHWDIPAIRRAFELFIDFNRCSFNDVYHASITHGI